MEAEPQTQHDWLKQLVGDWDVLTVTEEGDHEGTGTETVGTLGDLWIVARGEGRMGDGPTGYWMMTVGYDTDEGRFVGTWVGSMMANMFVYDGQLDEAGEILTLETLGPDMKGQGRDTRYRDIIQMANPDERTMTSLMLTDGEWTEIMKTTFRRRA